MAETRFLKTVVFGGYDRTDVIRRLEILNNQIFDLKNELRETKLLMGEYKKGTDEEKAFETVLAGEKAKLTNVQVQNETLSAKIKVLEQENQELSDKVENLTASVGDLTKCLTEANGKLDAISLNDSTKVLTDVFVKAQKSACDITDGARKEADKLEKESKDTAQEIIDEANNTAAQIIYEAEKTAAEKDAETQNKVEEMTVASGNLKAVMYEEVKALQEEFSRIHKAFDEFEQSSASRIDESEKVLAKTERLLAGDEIPTYKNPKLVEADIPEPPAPKKTQKNEEANAKLEKLQKMADAAASGKKVQSLDALAKQAAALGGGASAKADKPEKKKVDLNDLAKQAEALGGAGSGKPAKKKVDLAALAKQAQELENK